MKAIMDFDQNHMEFNQFIPSGPSQYVWFLFYKPHYATCNYSFAKFWFYHKSPRPLTSVGLSFYLYPEWSKWCGTWLNNAHFSNESELRTRRSGSYAGLHVSNFGLDLLPLWPAIQATLTLSLTWSFKINLSSNFQVHISQCRFCDRMSSWVGGFESLRFLFFYFLSIEWHFGWICQSTYILQPVWMNLLCLHNKL